MTLVQFLFSFQGRVRRLHLWAFFLVMSVVYGALFWPFGPLPVSPGEPPNLGWSFSWVSHNPLIGLFALAAIWMKLAVLVKRWHDRDKSGWWVLITLVPLIGWLWQLIECGFLDGTPGPNRYGPSPKGL